MLLVVVCGMAAALNMVLTTTLQSQMFAAQSGSDGLPTGRDLLALLHTLTSMTNTLRHIFSPAYGSTSGIFP